jgi:hypothetical protein
MPDLDPMAEALASLGRPIRPPTKVGQPTRRASSTFAPPVESEVAPFESETSQPFRTKRGALKFQPNSDWSLSRLPEVESLYKQRQGTDLPVRVRGQGAIHNKWNYDHHDSADVGLNPSSKEGQALLSQLQEQKIPFLAFDHAIPGVATGPHIHIGRASHRLGQRSSGAQQIDDPMAEALAALKADAPQETEPLKTPQVTSTVNDTFDQTLPETYDTVLSPSDEQSFQAWKKQYAPNDSGADYDLRGVFKAGLKPDPNTDHWPDTFKKPNHPTFSDESQYAVGDNAAKAGHWNGDMFVPATSKAAKPIEFQETGIAQPLSLNPVENIANVLNAKKSQQATGLARLQREHYESPKSLDVGERVKIPFKSGAQPTPDEAVHGFLSVFGPEYAELGKRYKAETGQNILKLTASQFQREPDGSYYVRPSRGAIDYINAYGQGGLEAADKEAAKQHQEFAAAQQEAIEESKPDIKAGEAATQRGVDSPFIRGATGGAARAAQAVGSVLPESLGGFESKASVMRAAAEEADRRAPLATTSDQIKAGLGEAIPGAMMLGATAPLGAAQLPALGALEGSTPEERLRGGLEGAVTQATFGLGPHLAPNITGAAQKALTGATLAGIPTGEAVARGQSPVRALAGSLPYVAMPFLHRGETENEKSPAPIPAREFEGRSPVTTSQPSSAIQPPPVEESQRYYHRDWGEVVKAEDQTGARPGRTKVYETDNPDQFHFPKTADLSGSGNQRMVPVRRPAEAAPTEQQAADPMADALTSLGAKIHRSQELDAGPAQFRGVDDSALHDLATRALSLPKGTPRGRRQQLADEQRAARVELQRRQTEIPMEIVPPDTGLRADTGDVPSFREYVENRPAGGIRFETLEPASHDFNRLAEEYTARYGTPSTSKSTQGASRIEAAPERPRVQTQSPAVLPERKVESEQDRPEQIHRAIEKYLDETDQGIADITSDADTHQHRDFTGETADHIQQRMAEAGQEVSATEVEEVLYKLRAQEFPNEVENLPARVRAAQADREQATEATPKGFQGGAADDPMAEALKAATKTQIDLVLHPAAAHLRTAEALKNDDPLNPKAKPLVSALNDAGIPTAQSGDLYGKNLVYVDLPGGKYTEGRLTRGVDTYERALRSVKLPEGWKVIRADTPASAAFETGKAEKPYNGPRSTAVRLIRKGAAVTPAEAREVAQAVKTALSRPLKVLATPSASMEALKTPGQKVRVGNLDSEVVDAQRLNDVDYELYRAGEKGAVRVYDADSGNVVSINKYPKFTDAAKAYNEAVKAEGGDTKGWRDRVPADLVKDIPTEAAAAREELPPVRTLSVGRESKAVTERGSEVNTRYAIVDLEDLITSHDSVLNANPKFPQELQPRERDRVASADQISRIASQLRPEFLGESPKASEGAPIVGHDGIVESGNGRVLGIRQAYESGTGRARAYRSYLKENAERLGLDAETIKDAKRPVLVRIRTSEVDRPQFVKEANEQSIASMSPVEQARSDAKMLKGKLLDLFRPTETGDINTSGNINFVRAFMKDVVGPNEIGRYTTASGQLSQVGVARIRNAIFARAYGESPEGLVALEKLAESPDNNVRNITTAMLRNAPGFASLREGIDQGTRYPLDLAPDISSAMGKMSSLREQGMPVADYLKQGGLYGEDLTPTQKRLLQVFDENKRGANTIDAILRNYLRGAEAAGSPDQMGMFGGETPSKADFLEAAILEAIDAHTNVSPDLFAASDQGLQAQPSARGADSEANARFRTDTVSEASDTPTNFAPRLSESTEGAAHEAAGHPLRRFDSTIDRLKSQEEEARQRLAERSAEFLKLSGEKGSELGATTIPQDLYDYVVIGASKLAQRSLNVAQFVDEMVKEFGETIRKHARQIFKMSHNMVTETQKEVRRERLSKEIADRLFSDNVPKEQQREALRIAARFRTSTDTQGKFLSGFKSRVGEMAKSYGAAGGELTNRLHLGDIARGHEMEAGNKYLTKIQDVYGKVKNDFERQRISDSVISALENRAEANQYLDTPEKQAVYDNTKAMLDEFRGKLKALGYETREDYFTHIRDVDILDQIMSDAKDPKDVSLNDLVAAKSRFLQTRVDTKMEIKKDLPRVLFAYLKSVTKEIAYSDAVQYYYDHFATDIPISLRKHSMDRAIHLMQNSLKPEQGRGMFYRTVGRLRSEQYRNFLSYNLKAAAQNFTQVDFARMRWTPEARSLAGKMWRNRKALTGPLAEAIDVASTEQTPLMRFLEQFKGEEPSGSRGRISEAFNRYDPFQRSEGRNWALSELGSVINSVVKRPEYKELKAKLGAESAINKLLEKQEVFDGAVREAATTAAETQVAANPAMRGEFYDAPLHRIIGMFTAFKTRQLQILGEALRSHDGINGARAQTILRRGLSGDAQPVEVLREIEAQRHAMETMVKRAGKFREDVGISRRSLDSMVQHLKGQESELNAIIKRIEPLSGGRVRSAALVGKYFAKVAAISVFFNLFWNSVYSAIAGPEKDEDAEERVSTALRKAFWDVLPTPFYGANPSKFLVSPIAPNFEASASFGHVTKRGLTRDIASYGTSVIPFAGVVDRMTNRRLSGAVVDVIAPKKEREQKVKF